MLREDIISKAEDELRHQMTQEDQTPINKDMDIYERRCEIEKKYDYDQAQMNFGLVVRDLNSVKLMEADKPMLILVNKWSEEMYDEVRIGQHLR